MPDSLSRQLVLFSGVTLALSASALLFLLKDKPKQKRKSKTNEEITVVFEDKRELTVPIGTNLREFAQNLTKDGDASNLKLFKSDGTIVQSIDELKSESAVFLCLPKEIPKGPTPFPFVGNLPQVSSDVAGITAEMTKHYGYFFPIYINTQQLLVICDPELAALVLGSPEKFPKYPSRALRELRPLAGDGLFTAADGEENWALAHRILSPAFNIKAIRQYIPDLVHIVNTMLQRWERFAPQDDVPVSLWMTKMTVDVIGHIGFGYEFHSLETDQETPFPIAMKQVLVEAGERARRTSLGNFLNRHPEKLFFENIKYLHSVVHSVLDSRTQEPNSHANYKDLLTYMLNTPDHLTGKKLDRQNIVYQVVTFLIAGNVTTSALLSWTMYFLSQNPHVEKKCQEEVEKILGEDGMPTEKNIGQFKYLNMVLREALRMRPSANVFSRACLNREDTHIGPYKVPGHAGLLFNVVGIHYNEKFWPQPKVFDPERFNDQNRKKIHPYAWIPFAAGPRACIGNQFALTEAVIALACIVRKYYIRLSPNSKADVTKFGPDPSNLAALLIRIHKRGRNLPVPEVVHSPPVPSHTELAKPLGKRQDSKAPPIIFAYGSNTGTCEDIANQLSAFAESEGIKTRDYVPLDHLVKFFTDPNISPPKLLVVVTSTYNGKPPDNAREFDKWLNHLNRDSNIFGPTKFVVFGVGNSQWQSFQGFPRKIDNKLEALGGVRLFERGEVDVDNPSLIEEALTEWQLRWITALHEEFEDEMTAIPESPPQPQLELHQLQLQPQETLSIQKPSQLQEELYDITFVEFNADDLKSLSPGSNATLWRVQKLVDLQSPSTNRRTVHIELEIPEGSQLSYTTGDHAGVYPANDLSLVEKIAKRLKAPLEKVVIIKLNPTTKKQKTTTLPLNRLVTVKDLLSYWIDLQAVPSRSVLQTLSQLLANERDKSILQLFSSSSVEGFAAYKQYFVQGWRTIVDVLEECPSVEISLGVFLEIAPRIQPRFYSISSASSVVPRSIHLSVGVVNTPIPGTNRVYHGVSSTFLGSRRENDSVFVFLPNNHTDFRLPADPTKPIVMVCAGTGFSPFRAFLHERQYQKTQNPKVGEAYLFFGCRHPDQDYIYQDEIKNFLADGTLTDVFVAFSRKYQTKEYVQDLLLANKEKVWKWINSDNAIFYVCGSAKTMAKDVKNAVLEIFQTVGDRTPELANQYLYSLLENRSYLEDVWG